MPRVRHATPRYYHYATTVLAPTFSPRFTRMVYTPHTGATTRRRTIFAKNQMQLCDWERDLSVVCGLCCDAELYGSWCSS